RFDMLNVKYLIVSQPSPQFDAIAASERFAPVFSEGLVAVFENKTALARFFVVPASGIEVIGEVDRQLARLKEESFDPEQSVIFSSAPLVNAVASNSDAVQTNVDAIERGMNAYRLRMQSSGAAVLVASQMYYPGWKATVDGTLIPVYPVNVA